MTIYDPEKHRPAENPDPAIGYRAVHNLLGLERVELSESMERRGRGETLTPKEDMTLGEATLMDIVVQILEHFRREDSHNLRRFNGEGHTIADYFFTEPDFEQIPNPPFEAIQQRVVRLDGWDNFMQWAHTSWDNRMKAIEMVSTDQSDTLLYCLLHAEHALRLGIQNGDTAREVVEYQEYIEVLKEERPQLFGEELDYPAFRKMARGMEFGPAIQWRIIKRFPQMAAQDLGMQWDEEAFDLLFEALKPLVRKLAHIHGMVLVMQSQTIDLLAPQTGLPDLSDYIRCRKTENGAQLFVDLILVQTMQNLFSHMPKDDLATILSGEMNNNPITGCPALESKLFEHVEEWNREIARDILL